MHPAYLHATVRRPAREQHQIEHAQLKALNVNGSTGEGYFLCQPRSESKKFPNHSSAFRFWVYFLNFSLPKYFKNPSKNPTKPHPKKGAVSSIDQIFFRKKSASASQKVLTIIETVTSPTYGYSFNKTSLGGGFKCFFNHFFDFHPRSMVKWSKFY